MNRITITLFFNIFFASFCFSQNSSDVIIGKQIWLKDNLTTKVFSNGDSIPFAKTEKEWRIAGEHQQPIYTFLKDNKGEIVLPHVFIYNWYVVNDHRGIAPKGYRVPTNSDLMELINFSGGVCETSRKIKSKTGWDKNDIVNDGDKTENGIDEYGFNMTPMPSVLPTGQFNYAYLNTGFWASNEAKNGAEYTFMSDNLESSYKGHMSYCFNITYIECMNYVNLFFKEGGLAIKCIKENPEKNSFNYPIYIVSNTKDNFLFEKNKHVEALCNSCDFVKSEVIKNDSASILKEVYLKKEDRSIFNIYFNQSNYMNPNTISGIGAVLAKENGNIKITSLAEGGACEMAKVISINDVILGIYEKGKLLEYKNIELSEAIKKIRGPENTSIQLLLKSAESKKQYKVKLIRKKLANWDFVKMVNSSIFKSVFPGELEEYFYYQYKKLPIEHQFSGETDNRLGYIISKAQRLYHSGPTNFSIDEYFHFPKETWDKEGIISGAYQLGILFKGGSEKNPIMINKISDAENLLMSLQFEKMDVEEVASDKKVLKFNFKHIVDKTRVSIYFKEY